MTGEFTKGAKAQVSSAMKYLMKNLASYDLSRCPDEPHYEHGDNDENTDDRCQHRRRRRLEHVVQESNCKEDHPSRGQCND